MKKSLILKILLVVFAMSMVCAMLVACDQDIPEPTHKCEHVCPVEGCGKCLDPDCKDPVCADKCPGHEPTPPAHECTSKCPTCGKCTNQTCTEDACKDKCQGHHVCESVCPICGKCLNSECTEDACKDKCQGHHVCEHVCPVEGCGKCLDPDCTDPVCAEKCPGHHTCTMVCPECNKCLDKDCTENACKDKCQGHDITGELKLDMSDTSIKRLTNAKVRTMGGKQIGLIDGDTTHFSVPTSFPDYSVFEKEDGVLKARYMATNTPESTGTIEPWGQLASKFNKQRLANAYEIVVESDTDSWNKDSTGSRVMVWIWYKATADSEYRNLNIELLENGLAVPQNAYNNRYTAYCERAINYARAAKLYVYSEEKDPDFFYGDAVPVTLKALRTDLASYVNKKVAVEGVVAYREAQTCYIEDYDAESGVYLGFVVYLGFNSDGGLLSMLKIGNRVRIVGTVSDSDNYGPQISSLVYDPFAFEDDGTSCWLIQKGQGQSFQEVSGKTFKGNVSMTVKEGEEEVTKAFAFGELAHGATISMKNLKVTKVYTTQTGNSKGAMTLTCTAEDGTTIEVRTAVLYDADGNLVTADAYKGKTINVRGVVDYYDNDYQIKVFASGFIEVL